MFLTALPDADVPGLDSGVTTPGRQALVAANPSGAHDHGGFHRSHPTRASLGCQVPPPVLHLGSGTFVTVTQVSKVLSISHEAFFLRGLPPGTPKAPCSLLGSCVARWVRMRMPSR